MRGIESFGFGVFVVVDADFWSNQRITLVTRESRREKMGIWCWKPEFKNRNAQKGPAWDGMASNLNSNNHYLFPPPTFKPLSVQKKFDNGIRTALLNIGRAASQFGESILKRAEKSGKCWKDQRLLMRKAKNWFQRVKARVRTRML